MKTYKVYSKEGFSRISADFFMYDSYTGGVVLTLHSYLNSEKTNWETVAAFHQFFSVQEDK